MKKEILSTYKKIYRIAWLYIISCILLGFVLLLIVAFLEVFINGETVGLIYYCLIHMAIGAVIYFPLVHIYRDYEQETSHSEPYVLQLKCNEDRSICDYLVERLSMQQLPNGSYSSFVIGKLGFLLSLYQKLIQTLFKVQPPKGIYLPFVKWKNIMFLLYQLTSYDEKNYTSILETTTKNAWKEHGLKENMSVDYASKIGRINIILLDEMAEDAQEAVHCNAIYGLASPVTCIDIFIDLGSSKLYIPRLLSFRLLWDYRNFIRVIMELFEIED